MIIEEFKKYLLIDRHYSDNTIKSYINDLDIYLDYLTKKKIDYLEVEDKNIKDYLKFINNKDERTKAHQISVLRSFYKYLILEGTIKNNPMENIDLPKLSKKLPNVLTVDELLLIIEIKLC